jgi:hypothetical protein
MIIWPGALLVLYRCLETLNTWNSKTRQISKIQFSWFCKILFPAYYCVQHIVSSKILCPYLFLIYTNNKIFLWSIKNPQRWSFQKNCIKIRWKYEISNFGIWLLLAPFSWVSWSLKLWEIEEIQSKIQFSWFCKILFPAYYCVQHIVSSKILCPYLFLIYTCSTYPCRHTVVAQLNAEV